MPAPTPPPTPPSTPPASTAFTDRPWLAPAADAIIAGIRTDTRTARLAPDAPATTPHAADPRAQAHPQRPARRHAPSTHAVGEAADLARRLAFPGFFEAEPLTLGAMPDSTRALAARLAAHLAEQVSIALRYAHSSRQAWEPPATPSAPALPPEQDHWAHWFTRLRRAGLLAGAVHEDTLDCELIADRVARLTLEGFPELRRLLAGDTQAAFDGDPAAEHPDEVILCYPGLNALFHHRLAHALYRLGVPLLPRMIAERAHTATGIDIHPGARVGERFFIDHGAGTVIGETTVIGHDCKIYQGVTLGAKSFDKDAAGNLIRSTKRHPTLGNRVTIYAGAVILGGDTTIGDDCIINGGVFITSSAPPGHIVRQTQPDLTLRSNPSLRRNAP